MRSGEGKMQYFLIDQACIEKISAQPRRQRACTNSVLAHGVREAMRSAPRPSFRVPSAPSLPSLPLADGKAGQTLTVY